MDCTLLFVVLFKNGSKFILGQLGDGAICVVEPNQGLKASSFDDRFKASANMTKTVCSTDAKDYFTLKVCPALGFVGFFLTTDGLENELYSRAGKVKKKVDWYYNLISNNAKSYCVAEIKSRWDVLTSDESYGFTDDMSLIAIVQLKSSIELPEDANWLCACSNRNRMESTRCESCDKDFLKVYKGINFKQDGGNKLAFFTRINENPQEELHVLQLHCEYPLEFPVDKQDEVQDRLALIEQPFHEPVAQGHRISAIDYLHQYIENKRKPNTHDKEAVQTAYCEVSPQQYPNHSADIKQIEKAIEVYSEHGHKNKNVGKLNIIVFLLIAIAFGIIVHIMYDIAIKANSKTAIEIQNLKKANDIIQSENNFLTERIAFLNARLVQLEEAQNTRIRLSDDYDFFEFPNGDIYIGQLSKGVPNGSGVIYSSGVLMMGYFLNGMKNGEFFIQYFDGNSEVRIYKMDKQIPEANVPSNHMIMKMRGLVQYYG
jgi:hypothetical protein